MDKPDTSAEPAPADIEALNKKINDLGFCVAALAENDKKQWAAIDALRKMLVDSLTVLARHGLAAPETKAEFPDPLSTQRH